MHGFLSFEELSNLSCKLDGLFPALLASNQNFSQTKL